MYKLLRSILVELKEIKRLLASMEHTHGKPDYKVIRENGKLKKIKI